MKKNICPPRDSGTGGPIPCPVHMLTENSTSGTWIYYFHTSLRVRVHFPITFPIIIIIIIIIIITIIIFFMQGIYTYIPETIYVPREYSVASILLLLHMVLISLVPVLNILYFYISTFRCMCAVPNMAVFCSSLTSCFPGMLLTYFLTDFDIVPVAPVITVITFDFTFHKRCISIVRSLYFRIFFFFFFFLLLLSSLSFLFLLYELPCFDSYIYIYIYIYSVRKFYPVNFTHKETTPSIHSPWN